MSRRFWTEDRIISEIQRLHKQGEDLWYRAMERNHKDLIRASERYYKGWKNAVIAAGFDYDNIKKRSHQVWTKEKILSRLNELRKQGENLRSSNVQKVDKKLYHAAIRQYKNFNIVLAELNKEYGQVHDTIQHPEVENIKTEPAMETTDDAKAKQKMIKESTVKNMKVFTVRTRVRSERNVGETLIKKSQNGSINIGTIQYPAILNGYIFVECDDRETLARAIKTIRNAQGLLNGETTLDEISGYIDSPKSKKSIIEGAKVEITEGQFKGEHAIIQNINERKKEVTVELIDEILKIPIVIPKKNCKAI